MLPLLNHSFFLFFGLSFIFCFFLIPVYIRLSLKNKLFEKKGGRRIHVVEIPSMGGITIFLAFLLGLSLLLSFDQFREIRFLLGASFLIFILGLRDDLIPLKPSLKLLSQIFPALIIIYDPVFNIQNMGPLFFGGGILHEYLIYFLLVVIILFITNSINLVDGIDGLAGSLAIISFQFFTISFFFQEQYLFMALSLLLTGATTAFLWYNWSPAKIFMGDTGALLLGFFIAIFALKVSVENTFYNHPVLLCIAALAVPIYDTLRTFINRICRGKSPFFADKTHVHHLLLRLGMSHQKATLILAGLQIVIILAALAIEPYNKIYSILLILLLIFGFNFWLEKELRSKIKLRTIVKLRC